MRERFAFGVLVMIMIFLFAFVFAVLGRGEYDPTTVEESSAPPAMISQTFS
ncbi:MAG: hypothetical protein WA982_11280 [Rubrobacteraceae bacterium]